MNDIAQAAPSHGLVAKFADRYSVEPGKLMATLKATAFKQRNGEVPTNEQMMALLVVADQYRLNPFTREIFAFPDKQNGIIPVVGVDGWSRIINSHPEFDGMEYRYSDALTRPEEARTTCYEWIECVMHRKDRQHPIVVREYLDEVYRKPFKKDGRNGPYVVEGPWQTHPKRFLRHKVTIQCARLAFGFVGIHDPDEAERIIESTAQVQTTATVVQMPRAKSEQPAAPVAEPKPADVADAEFSAAEDAPQDDAAGVYISEAMQKVLFAAAHAAGISEDALLDKYPRIDTGNFAAIRAELKALAEAV